MGHGPPLLPVAPSRGSWHAVLSAWLPACLVPVGLARCVGGGGDNIKEGDPHGPRAPVVAWGATKMCVCVCACVPWFGQVHKTKWVCMQSAHAHFWGGVEQRNLKLSPFKYGPRFTALAHALYLRLT
jgi:hypothetical protein